MNDLKSIPAYLMRGGTSKGLIFHKKDLPNDRNVLTQNLLKINDPLEKQIKLSRIDFIFCFFKGIMYD